MSEATEYLTGQQVRARYGGRPAIWLWRRQKEADFPKPIYIGSMKYFSLADIIAYENKKRCESAPAEPEHAKAARLEKTAAAASEGA